MPLIRFDGRVGAVNIAGNYTSVIVPTIADPTLSKVLLSEIEAGTAFECSVREVAIAGSANNSTDQWLCDVEEVETPGAVRWALDPLVVTQGDPQKPNPFVDGLVRGSTVGLVERRGPAHMTTFAASQMVSLARLEVSHVENMPAVANANGDKFQVRVHWAVKRYNRTAVVAAA